MNEFVSVLDLIDNPPYGAQRAVKDEVADMLYGIRRTMDLGLSSDEMPAARAAETAASSAMTILDKLFA